MSWRSRACMRKIDGGVLHWLAFTSVMAAYVQRKDRWRCRIWCLVSRLHADDEGSHLNEDDILTSHAWLYL